MERLALFDLDNTLIDREAAFLRWATDFVTAHDLPQGTLGLLLSLDDDGYRPRQEMFAALKSEVTLPASVDDLVAAYRIDYPRTVSRDESVRSGLSRLRRAGWKVAIVTNGPSTQLAKVEAAGLTDCVDACCVSEAVGVSKPHPAIFETAARMAGCSLAGWMVGDNPHADIGGATAVGLRTIWLHRGRRWSTTDFRPTLTSRSVTEAIDRILDRAHTSVRAPQSR